MSIGGIDIIQRAPAEAAVAEIILRACETRWPTGLFQDANADEVQPFSDPAVWSTGTSSREFFVYRDKDAAKCWQEKGASPENRNTMLHFLVNDIAEEKFGCCEVTLVCDEQSSFVNSLLEELRTIFRSQYRGSVPVRAAA